MEDSTTAAINQVLRYLEIDCVTDLFEEGITKGRRSVLGTLHKLVVALCIGNHLDAETRFVGELDEAQFDNSKYRVILESISGETKCNTQDAFNIVAYTTLEYLLYPRMSQITLGSDQDVRELFLAFVFLLSTQGWFARADKNSPEYLDFRRHLVDATQEGSEALNISEKLNQLDVETVAIYLKQRLRFLNKNNSGNIISSDEKEGKETTRVSPTSIDTSSSDKVLPLVNFLKASDANRTSRLSDKVALATAEVITTMSTPSGAKSEASLQEKSTTNLSSSHAESGKKPARVGLILRKEKRVETSRTIAKSNIADLFIGIERAVADVISDLEAKAHLLCRAKSTETFDTEYLRTIIGQNEQQVMFNNLMDNGELLSSDGNGSMPGKSVGKATIGNVRLLESKDRKSVNQGNDDDVQALLDEIEHLSHTIIQTQSRIKRLTEDVERGDSERLHSYHKVSESLKVDTKSSKGRGSAQSQQDSVITDRYSIPSPSEWLLVSQKETFMRSLSLLKMINKSLENEAVRSSIYETAINVLKHLKPESSSNRSVKKGDTHVEQIELLKAPNDIKETVSSLKHFMVDGMPPENFQEEDESRDQVEQAANDFLRHINSNFSKYRTASLSSEKEKKGSFINYITNVMKDLANKTNTEAYGDTTAALNFTLHLFEEAAEYAPRINLTNLSKWIQSKDNDGEGTQTNHESIKQREKRDFVILQMLVNKGPTLVYNDGSIEVEHRCHRSGERSILDFTHYFNMAREGFGNKSYDSGQNEEPSMKAWNEELTKQNKNVVQRQMLATSEAYEHFTSICKKMPSITFIE